jgi:hypothetical protein
MQAYDWAKHNFGRFAVIEVSLSGVLLGRAVFDVGEFVRVGEIIPPRCLSVVGGNGQAQVIEERT